MDVYFSKHSLSHFKVDEENRQIIVCLKNGENLIVNTNGSFEDFREYLGTLTKMLKEYESYNNVVRYDENTKKLYF